MADHNAALWSGAVTGQELRSGGSYCGVLGR